MAKAPLSQTLLITAGRMVTTLTDAVTVPSIPGPVVTLGTITLSGSLQIGFFVAVTLSGWTAGSSLASNIPGMSQPVFASGTWTITGTPTGSAATIANGIVETLPGAVGSPKSSPITVAAAPTLSLSSAVTQPEGNTGTVAFAWTLTLSRNGSNASFAYSYAVTGTGANPANAADFGGTLPSGSGTFAPGETTKTITVLVAGDTAVEPDETFLLSVTAVGLNSLAVVGTITNEDATGINAPVLTKTSSAGASPLLFSIYLDSTAAAGMYWRLRRTNAQAGGAPNWADSSAQTETRMITLDDFNGNPEFALLQGQPNGYNAFDLEVYDDSGRVSGRNGYVSDTITAVVSSTVLTTTNGTQKSQYASVTGTPALLLDAVDTGALNAVMANSSMVGFKHLEAVCLGIAPDGNLAVGICDAAAVVGPTIFNFHAGDSGKLGFSIDFTNPAAGTPVYNVWVNGAQAAQSAFTLLTDDVVALEPNSTANTVKVIHRRGSTETVIGTWTLTTGIPADWRSYAAAAHTGDRWRMRYGATADPFTVTVSSGANFYG